MLRSRTQIVFTLSIVLSVSMLVGCKDRGASETKESAAPSTAPLEATAPATRTGLVIQNNTSQSTDVFVVLAALGGACNTNKPPITADQLKDAGFCDQVVESGTPPYAGKCQFTLGANQSKPFPNIPNTCISGNITFGAYPSCPTASFPNGFTTAEFTLNPSAGAEDVDVSLVNGYNYNVTMTMEGGGGWAVSSTNPPQAITQISPKPLGKNIGNPGVYPEDCTDCIQLVGQPVCPGFPTNPTCQPARICDAQRAFSSNGGTVTVALQP